CTAAELFSAKIDLNNRGVFWEKLLVRKVSPKHEQGVAVHHGVVTGGKSEQPGHADIERVVVLDELLPAQCMHDRGVDFTSHLDQFGVSAGAARTAQDGDLVRVVENLG